MSKKHNERLEKDTIGGVYVPGDAYYGAQTYRSLHNFDIGNNSIPLELIKAFALIKIACAQANFHFNKLSENEMKLIVQAGQEIIEGKFDQHFPLKVWQTGSGTQTNMNVNEVIANRANELAGHPLGSYEVIRPTDHVNLSQSSNDTFPTAMHICAYQEIESKLLPNLKILSDALRKKENEFKSIIKIGRTHLQDATPMTLGQEFSGFVTSLDRSYDRIQKSLDELRDLAIGGTAVGTGLNAPKGFSNKVCEFINAYIKKDLYRPHPNKFTALSFHDEIVNLAGVIDILTGNLFKIANDIRYLSSGPRSGIGEITIPANEPGSSIMPGKVNPTQCEAMTMVAIQVSSMMHAISLAGSQGQFQLNVYKPLIIFNITQAVTLLSDTMKSFKKFCVDGIEANTLRIDTLMSQSLMLVTALTPEIGYYKAAKIAQHAHETGQTLKEACLELKYLTEKKFDSLMKPESMI